MGDFEQDTRLEEAGDGRYTARLSRDWEIWGPNGGYLASIGLRAAGQCAKVDRPVSFSGHFLSVARFGVVDVEVRVLKAGRRAESLGVSITQGERRIFEGLLRTAAESEGLEHDVARIPESARPADLREIHELVPDEESPHPFWGNFRVKPVWPERFEPGERRAHAPLFREWWRFQPRATFDDPWVDAARSLLILDTVTWPAACQPHPDRPYTAPNMDVTAWFHRPAPDSEWLMADGRCEIAAGGLMGTHTRVWSEDGSLVASGGAQLLCVRNPSPR